MELIFVMGMPVITPSTTTRDQAITDIIQSVALEQTARLTSSTQKVRRFRKW